MADVYTALASHLSEKIGEVVTRAKAKKMLLARCYDMAPDGLEKIFREDSPGGVQT